MKSYQQLILSNKAWVQEITEQDPQFFKARSEAGPRVLDRLFGQPPCADQITRLVRGRGSSTETSHSGAATT